MTLWAAVTALLAASASAELQCVGRLAHEVKTSLQEGDLSVHRAPQRDPECLSVGSGKGVSGDKSFCLGVNQNEQCNGPVNPLITLPYGLQCRNCFVAAGVDVFYDFEVENFSLEKIGFGFRGAHITSDLRFASDGDAQKPGQRVARTLLGKPIEFHVPGVNVTFKLAMPTEIFYEGMGREYHHGDVGAMLDIDMGDVFLKYEKGQGISHSFFHMPKISVKPHLEADLTAVGVLKVGFNTTLSVSFGDMAEYTVYLAGVAPVTASSEHENGSHVSHNCLTVTSQCASGGRFHFDAFGQSIGHSFGPQPVPFLNRDLVHLCRDFKLPFNRSEESIVV
jgi:hypothetical protein